MAAAHAQVIVAPRTLFELTGEYVDVLDRAWRVSLPIQGLLVDDGKCD